jgi:putative ATP-binding cassette transporter
MKLISFLFRYSGRMLALALLAGLICGASSTGLVVLINARLRASQTGIATLVWGFVILAAVMCLTRITSESILAKLGQGALFNLRLDLSRQILGVPLRRLEELGSHRLLATLTDDVPNITGIVASIPVLCINLAVVIGCLIYLGWLSWIVLLGFLIFMAIGVASYQLPVVKALNYFRQAREDGDKLYHDFHALVDGAKELKLNRKRREAFISDELGPTAAAFRQKNVIAMTIYATAASWGQLLVFIVIGLVLFALPSLKSVDLPVLTGYTLALLFMTTPLQSLMNTAPALGRANVALKKVEELGLTLKTSSSEESAHCEAGRNGSWLHLELLDVAHRYHREGDDSDFILGPINISVSPGEIVFLVGGNGSGKTTFAKLFAGLYSPEEGEIRLDGDLVTEQNRDSYRQHFSAVFNDFYLFDKVLGIDHPELDRYTRELLARLQLDHKVEVKDGKLSTIDLSQGQRKRLALLTAYLEDRHIYIFDEWAADQDPLFKEIFYYQLLPDLKARGKMVLVISHDDRYYHMGDRIIKLDYGQAVYDKPSFCAEDFAEELSVPAQS